jgi:twitching motility protein PilT
MTPLQDLLVTAKDRAASDVLVMVGDAPAMRVAGQWVRYDHPKCASDEVENVLREILRPEAWRELVEKRELDFSCNFPKTGRVRCNAHFQRDHLSLVLRLVWPSIPDPVELGIPPHVVRAGDLPHGLLLVSGPTGAGKSTTLAAIVEYINRHRAAHVITIEDPIEFIYTNARAIIEQREIGSDTLSWHAALRTVLRQAPDVIVLGELRDLDSIAIALGAAETGHLVMASVHASTAAGAISRMVDVFPSGQASQIRIQLAQTLRMVFAQDLVPGCRRETRTLLYEILVNTPAVANLIRLGEFEQIFNAMSAGREHGMITFAQCRRELQARNIIGTDLAPLAPLPATPPLPKNGSGKTAPTAKAAAHV